MPAYNTARSYVVSPLPGDAFQVWNAEQPAPGNGGASASQQVAIALSPGKPTAIEVDGFFSAAPGVFGIEIQAALNDVEAQYQTILNGAMTAVDANNFTFHFDGEIVARFVRLLMRSRTNAVNVTASIRRG